MQHLDFYGFLKEHRDQLRLMSPFCTNTIAYYYFRCIIAKL